VVIRTETFAPNQMKAPLATLGDRMRLMVLSIAILAVVSMSGAWVALGHSGLFHADRALWPALMALCETLALVIAGGTLLVRVCNPFIRRLEESEARIRAILSTAGDGIITVDMAGTIDSFNLAAEQMFGCTGKQAIGRNINDLIALPSGLNFSGEELVRWSLPIDERSQSAVGKRSSGIQFPLELSISPVHIGDRTVYTVIARDVTELAAAQQQTRAQMLKLRQAKETLEAKAAELAKSNRELDDFTYIASHDLKEPLRGISSYCQILLEDYGQRLDEDGSRRLKALVILCQRLGQLIDDLLKYSQMGRTQPESTLADLNEVVADVLDTLGPAIDQRRALVRVHEPLPVFAADRVWIGEVFRNLITNALKFNDSAEPVVDIGCTDGKALFVRDNGIGIPECHHEAIFTMFRRLHSRQKYDGTGAGLTFVRKIVEAHGGQVWVESEVGCGATFYFTLGSALAYARQELASCSAG
jgi:PAS domain S-box-containing protein